MLGNYLENAHEVLKYKVIPSGRKYKILYKTISIKFIILFLKLA